MHDVLIIGGGVIGLSLAWELARRGSSVHVIDQGQPGREASWAGAGVLPPAVFRATQHPSEQLRGLACELHPQWAEELRRLTGIDTGYRRCGGLHLARTPGEAAALAGWAESIREDGVEVMRLNAADLGEIEPGIAIGGVRVLARPHVLRTEYPVLGTKNDHARGPSAFRDQCEPTHAASLSSEPPTPSPRLSAILLPGEAQLRNPRHLKALLAACGQAGVTITPNVASADFAVGDGELTEIRTSAGSLSARQYCFAAGAWTGQILARLGIATGILPIRGQIVLYHCEQPPITRIVNEGSRYLVPRDDGRLLAGSTEEEVGFDKRTTEEAIAELIDFARGLVPALADAAIERTWAGLRPGSFDGLPYLGRLPGLANAYVAAGHFRTGLYLSPATAVVMSQLLRGEQPLIDLAPFRVGR